MPTTLQVTIYKASATQPDASGATAQYIQFAQHSPSSGPAINETFFIGPNAPNCVSSPTSETCTFGFTVAPGVDQWNVAILSATKKVISTEVLVKTVVAHQPNYASLTFNTVVRSVAFLPTASSCNAATPCTQLLALSVLDAAGATIIGPGTFTNAANVPTPIVLLVGPNLHLESITGAPLANPLATTMDNSLAQVVYDGQGSPGVQTVTAVVGGVPLATYRLTLAGSTSVMTASPTSLSLGAAGPTTVPLSVTAAGYIGAFSESDSCAGIANVTPVSTSGPTATYSVSQVAGGSCAILVSTITGSSVSIPVVSTVFDLNVQ